MPRMSGRSDPKYPPHLIPNVRIILLSGFVEPLGLTE